MRCEKSQWELEQEAKYWRAAAMWMADVHAANAQDAAYLKRTPKSERARQARISQQCADLLLERAIPAASSTRTLENIAERCAKASQQCAAIGLPARATGTPNE